MMYGKTLIFMFSIATLSVALPVAAAGLGGAVQMNGAATGDTAVHAGTDGLDHAMGSANAGERAGARVGVEGDAASRALDSAGASSQATSVVGEHAGSDQAGAALNASGPAQEALDSASKQSANMSDHTGANVNASLTGRVKSKLKSADELRGMQIKSVASDDGSVTLNGTVKSSSQKKLAENLVASISGVTEVNNNLQVQGQ